MGKARDQNELADCYHKAAGVAAIWIDPDCYVGAHGAATIDGEPGQIVYCCERGRHFELPTRCMEELARRPSSPRAG